MVKSKSNVWKFFKPSLVKGKKTASVKCIFCVLVFTQNATRMTKHLARCPNAPEYIRKEFKEVKNIEYKNQTSLEENENNNVTSLQIATDTDKCVQSPSASIKTFLATGSCASTTSSLVSASSSKNESGNYRIWKYIDKTDEKELDKLHELYARAVYTSEMPLSICEHPAWSEFFKQLRPSFKLPTRKALATNLLDKEFSKAQEEIVVCISKANNLALSTDSWSNIRNESIVNFVILTPKPHFIKSISTEANKHTSEYLYGLMKDVLEQYNPEKFLVIITDNAANEKKATKLLKNEFPHIIPLGCMSHTLNLLVQDILKMESVNKIMKRVIDIIKSIKKSHILLASFNKEKKSQISLSLPVPTRWGSHLKAIDSFLKSKSTLQKMAVMEETCNLLTKENKSKILDNDILFFVQVSKLAELIRPIVEWTFKLESDKPMIHEVYYAFRDIEESLKANILAIPLTQKEEKMILEKFQNRKEYALQSIHLAAVILDPKKQGWDLSSEELLIGIEFIDKTASDMPEVDSTTILAHLTKYRHKEDHWEKPIIWKALEQLEPTLWWKGVAAINCADLSKIAIRILSMPTSSASTERSFSTFGRVHTKIRNKLTTNRAMKLSFISHNYRLKKLKTLQETPKAKIPEKEKCPNTPDPDTANPETNVGRDNTNRKRKTDEIMIKNLSEPINKKTKTKFGNLTELSESESDYDDEDSFSLHDSDSSMGELELDTLDSDSSEIETQQSQHEYENDMTTMASSEEKTSN